jgi:hypothetical protein
VAQVKESFRMNISDQTQTNNNNSIVRFQIYSKFIPSILRIIDLFNEVLKIRKISMQQFVGFLNEKSAKWALRKWMWRGENA